MNALRKIYWRIKSLRPPYRGLRYRVDNGKRVWEGPLSFAAIFDSMRVKDTFEIRIELPTQIDGFPRVKEIGGRTQKMLSEGKVKNLIDLHINPSNTAPHLAGTICLCPQPEEKRRFPGQVDLKKFIQELVIPYFFALHQFEKTKKWAWGQYGHGRAGIMEYYLERRGSGDSKLLEDCLVALGHDLNLPFTVQLNGHELCGCNSGLQYRKCHPKALAGYKALISDDKKRIAINNSSKVST